MSEYASKIAALLRKAESSEHPEETETFLRKAKALMEKHQISLADLSKEEKKAEDPMGSGRSKSYAPGTPASTKYLLISKVAKYFGCFIVLEYHEDAKGRRREEVVYHGPLSARTMSEAMFPFIWNQVNYLANVHGKDRKEIRRLVRDISRSLSRRIENLISMREEKQKAQRQFGSTGTDLVVLDQIAQDTERFALSIYNKEEFEYQDPKKFKPASDLARELAETVAIDPQVEDDEDQLKLKKED